jgi:Flp pilus assembly pilin Flp
MALETVLLYTGIRGELYRFVYIILYTLSSIYLEPSIGACIMPHSYTARGQGLVEYALLLVLVSVAVIGILRALGPAISEFYGEAVDVLQIFGGSPEGGLVGISVRWQRWWWYYLRLRVEVEVSQPNTDVTVEVIEGSGTPNPASQTCDPEDECLFYIRRPSRNGTVMASAGGGELTADW